MVHILYIIAREINQLFIDLFFKVPPLYICYIPQLAHYVVVIKRRKEDIRGMDIFGEEAWLNDQHKLLV